MKLAPHTLDQSTIALWRLARAVGIMPAYIDNDGKHVRAAPETLLTVIQSWGVDISSIEDAPGALQQLRAQQATATLDPAYVLWQPSTARKRRPHHKQPSQQQTPPNISCALILEDGAELAVPLDHDGALDVNRQLHAIADQLPIGYHQLHLEEAGQTHHAHVFVAPPRAYQHPRIDRPQWGMFAPLYALHSARSWGIGDLTDLGQLADWLARQGGAVVGTLPLLATYLDKPFDPSPYAPISRRFFNEIYLDVAASPELASCPAAQRLLSSAEFQTQLQHVQVSDTVKYRQVMQLKRRVLELLSDTFFDTPSIRRDALLAQLQQDPSLPTYAAFRAATEQQRATWRNWPQRLHNGHLTPADYDQRAWHYHLYAQWLMRQQLAQTAKKGAQLYLDLPVGVNRDGFDVWQNRSDFVETVNIGAPPDDFFRGGQDWGLLPMHPQRSRQRGHADFRAAVQAQARYAGALRIDHIMSLHRLYWVPHGTSPTQGVYVRYPAEELYAILCIESHRHQTEIVGENLGTVPGSVNSSMERHGIATMYVAQFAWTADKHQPLDPPPAGAVASVNTHDVPSFAAFWRGDDIQQRIDMNLLAPEQAQQERKQRAAFRRSMHSAWLNFQHLKEATEQGDQQVLAALIAILRDLARSDARLVLLTLEDLWLERRPQNVPGTTDDRNWQRKMVYSLNEIFTMPQVRKAVQAVNSVTGKVHV